MHYYYQCFNCNKEYSAEAFEKAGLYLCPQCGKAEQNRPLTGVMRIIYDYSALKNKLNRNRFLKNTPGMPYDYPELWPLKIENSGKLKKITDKQMQLVSLPEKPVFEISVDSGNLSIFDDTHNPTFSYKDRASILVAFKAIQQDTREITMASTGNAGSSIAGICARLGLKAHIFVPKAIPLIKRLQIQSYGAKIYLVEGDYDQAFDLNIQVTQKTGWYNRNTAFNPLTIEGKKSAAFDMFLALKGKLPEIIIVPVGDGVILTGLFKGFYDLQQLGWIEKLPRLFAVQSSGSNALFRYMQTGKFEYLPASTIADSIHAGAPRNLFMASDAIKKSNGHAIEVDDSEIISAQEQTSKNTGLLLEPAAAATYAGYKKCLRQNLITAREKIMLMFTGNGLKDFVSLENWNRSPVEKSIVQWQEEFGIHSL